MRVDVLGDYVRVHITHVAECPEVDPITCATADIPEHLHDQTIDWFRLDPSVTVGLGRGWQVAAGIPVDVRVVRVDYTTLEGDPYDPPYDDIHHRDETLAGPVDGSLALRRYLSFGHTVVGAGLGTTLPIGRTEEDPFALGEQGLAHQHQQFGTGTFVPTASADAIYTHRRWGALAWAAGRLPLYDNGKGYRSPASLTVGLGPTFRVLPSLQLLASAELLLEGPESWSADLYGGRAAIVPGGGVSWSVSDQAVLQAQVRGTAWQHAREDHHGEGALVQPVIVTVGASVTVGRSPAAMDPATAPR